MTVPISKPPRVSVIMANYRGAEHLPAAIESVLAQTMGDLELIVSDDCSPDASAEIVRRFAKIDGRIRLLVSATNQGPGAARNAAIEAATGEWIAVVDSDDVLHAERLERLVRCGDETEADAVADNLLYFSESDAEADRTLLAHTAQPTPKLVSVAHFVRSNSSDTNIPPLGYLKPILRRASLGQLRYDEDVRIAEDYDFLLRFLLAGAKLLVVSDPLYLYRRHSTSLSHRLSIQHLEAMIANHRALYTRGYELPPSTRALLDYRLDSLARGLAYERLVAKLKSRDLGGVIRHLARQPSLIAPLSRSAREHVARRRSRKDVQRRENKVFVLTADPAYPDTTAASRMLREHPGKAVETIIVPPYGKAGREILLEQALWGRLAKAGLSHNIDVIAHGLAGMNASSYMPVTSSVTVLIDNSDDETTALRWVGARNTRFVRSDGTMLTDTSSNGLSERRLAESAVRTVAESSP